MFSKLLKYLFGSRNDRILKEYEHLLKKINLIELDLKSLSDNDLKDRYSRLKDVNIDVKDLDNLLPCVYAIVREVARRTVKMRHFDVQILGGIALYYGKIAEIATGEGKTLVATLPVCLFSLIKNKSVHLVTVNDYLAKRDAEWMFPIYDFLGLDVSVIISGMSVHDRKNAYASNVVYGNSSEFGFDYLRDNLVVSPEEKVQKKLFYAIVDEVDSILIDEARTPLIISLPDKFDSRIYLLIDKLVKGLSPCNSNSNDGHFILEEKSKHVQLTDAGFSYLESTFKHMGILGKDKSLYDVKSIELLHFVYASLKAYYFFKKDVDYIIRDGKVLIIDEHTGRIMDGRRWSDGLHQAIEAKELIEIKSENQTVASITFQNYFRLYDMLAGMTGTAYTESIEFRNIYNLEVVVIPTNKPCVREDRSDLVFLTKQAKYKAIISDIRTCYNLGRPVLVGTISISVSEFISGLLKKLDISHSVLNAKYHEKESMIISKAGKFKSVTIATNMAGRGTDIVLGGMSVNDAVGNISEYNNIVKLGGLKIIGTERHESRRIDNQLRGRSGRQGDPGCSQFYLSLEDDLVRLFIGEKTKLLLNKLSISESEVITHPLINKSIENAQKRVESYNFNIRKELLEFDDIVNEQRKVIYNYRDYLIYGIDISFIILDILSDISLLILKSVKSTDNKFYFVSDVLSLISVDFGFKSSLRLDVAEKEFLLNFLFDGFYEIYSYKKFFIDNKDILLSERILLINVLDIKWREHLLNLEHMKKGIYLRGYAQKDPKQEYKREAFLLFSEMLDNMKYEFFVLFLKLISQFNFVDSSSFAMEGDFSFEHTSSQTLGNSDDLKNKTFIRQRKKIGRNKMCFCNSGKKYKRCHGKSS